MITNFITEESYKRFTGLFNELYSQKKTLDKETWEILNNLENKFIYCGRKLYILENDDDFINTLESKGPKKYTCFKYVTKEYYNKHKNIYDKLFELKFYKIDGYKQFGTERLEIYIFDNFKGRTITNSYNEKINFVKEELHDKINIDKLKFINSNQVKGTFIDYCIKYIINNNYDYAYSYLMTCDKSIDYDNIPDNLEDCTNTKELIDFLFEKDFTEKILKLKEKFISLKTTECYINFDMLIYGEPDLISDDYIIDIKISDRKIDNSKNIFQTLFYAAVTNKKNICLYDPINGLLYKYQLTNDDINRIQFYINLNKGRTYNSNDLIKTANKKNIESSFIL